MPTKTQESTETLEKSNSKLSLENKTQKSGKESLKKIFEELLQDTYSAEQQLMKALPELAKASYNEDLQDAFENHLQQTQRQVERLENIFERLKVDKNGEKCKAMEGLIEEGQKIIKEHEDGVTRDAALIIAAQKVEHYEIAAYGSLIELADVLGLDRIADTLEKTLREEWETDELLSNIAQDVNDDAYEYSSQESEFNSLSSKN
jgi:ferritin-like metal-binding protein YciE